MTGRASREAVARWNLAYAEQTAAMFAAAGQEPPDRDAIRRLASAYAAVAAAWRALAAELAIPLWARHAAAIAAEEFDRRAGMEDLRDQQQGGRPEQ
ncbi:hypothetical protein [Actinokineospora iranica]|uniref:SAV-6107-like HEPN domain-containing protein n=1 Tax=Actinokineospora iranica TaxID=1271860 RepID=A0A1G6PI77_9PSEU|nr:hypothetical protein [Actinokineospora iranica]SDC79853.1 hypothetical protein SAMN05216174_104310 [Actinokineospora iranica]